MLASDAETKKEYKIEDLPPFFMDRSQDISTAFSDGLINISTICCGKPKCKQGKKIKGIQKISFKLNLLSTIDKNVRNTTLVRVKSLIKFFEICLYTGKKFIVKIAVSEESKEVCNNTWETVNEFIECAAPEVFLQGITIKLRVNIKDINLKNLHKVETRLEKKLKQAKNNEQSQIVPQAAQTNLPQQENAQNKQVVPVRGSFGFNVAVSRVNDKAPVVFAAIENNIPKYRIFLPFSNFLDEITRLFFLRTPKLPTQKQRALTYHPEPQEVEQDGVDMKKIDRIITFTSNVGQTTSHTEYFKANRKKSKVKIEQTQEKLEEKQQIIVLAQNDARIALIDRDTNQQKRTLDEIFVEIMNGYKNQDSETFRNIFNSVFKVVYFQDKQLHEILEPNEIPKVLKTLGIPKPPSRSLLDNEYLQKIVYRKKEQLLKLVAGIYTQQLPTQPENSTHKSTNSLPINKSKDPSPATNKAKTPPATNTAFKSSLKTVFSSKEAYFCLFVIGASISILCLWHFPLGKLPVLQGLVQQDKRENIGLMLNIGLPILIVLCIVNLAHFVYSEYSVESIGQVNSNRLPSRT